MKKRRGSHGKTRSRSSSTSSGREPPSSPPAAGRPNPPSGDPVRDVADALEAFAVPYAFTGALAFAHWGGKPRASRDIDVVVYPASRVQFARILNGLAEAGFEVDPSKALKEATEHGHTLFSVPIVFAGTTVSTLVDLILPSIPWLAKQEMARAVRVRYLDRPGGVPVVSAEDLVLFKLIFFRRDKYDLSDIETLLDALGAELDAGYVLIALEQLFPPTDERFPWFVAALKRHGLAG